MTAPKDTQEMLAEYGTFKSSQLEVLDILIDTLINKKVFYLRGKDALESINEFTTKHTPSLNKQLIKKILKTLTKWNIPHTKEDALPFIDSMINNIDECINELVEERR